MSHTSPATFLVWSIVSTLLGAYLFFHLWSFDRFKCLKWSNQPNSGAFKRLMTYTYLLSVPTIIIYAYGFAIMKYNVGFLILPKGGYVPVPYTLWPQSYQDAIFPLTLCFSISWAFEMITHLEELCFWLFLMNAGPKQTVWFKSPYFKIWLGGGAVALVTMPTLTSSPRGDHYKSEAYTFLGGSLGDLVLTIFFIPILWRFPDFVANLKREGVEADVVVRLTKFYRLNVIRVVFRFMFTLPLLSLGIDGVHGHHHPVNESMFWTDFLTIVAAFGCAISSVITLVIFFPLADEAEVNARQEASRQRALAQRKQSTRSHRPKRQKSQKSVGNESRLDDEARTPTSRKNYLLTDSPVRTSTALPEVDSDPFRSPKYELEAPPISIPLGSVSPWITEGGDMVTRQDSDATLHGLPPVSYSYGAPAQYSAPNGPPIPITRFRVEDLPSLSGALGLSQDNLEQHSLALSGFNPLVHTFTSPLDVLDQPPPAIRRRPSHQWA